MSDRLCIEKRDVKGDANATFKLFSSLQAVACDKGPFEPGGNKGCQGGQPYAAMDYAEKKGGLVPDACFPYLKSDGGSIDTCADEPCLKFQKTPRCPKSLFHPSPACTDGSGDWKHEANVLAKGAYIVQLSNRMAMDILTYGPITASMGVYQDFLNYTSGVYRQGSDVAVGAHAVKIIGWGVDGAQGGYWLVQNSWTERWGEAGYFRIAMAFGDDDPCECNICNLGVGGMFFGNHTDLVHTSSPSMPALT